MFPKQASICGPVQAGASPPPQRDARSASQQTIHVFGSFVSPTLQRIWRLGGRSRHQDMRRPVLGWQLAGVWAK